VRLDRGDSSRAVLGGADVDQAQYAAMANTSDDGQLAEVLSSVTTDC
jgi:hypothetical protein